MSTIYLPSNDLPEGYGCFCDNEPEFDYRKCDNFEFEGIDHKDAPDYCDAFVSYAEFYGRECTEEELDEINDDHEFVYENLIAYLY